MRDDHKHRHSKRWRILVAVAALLALTVTWQLLHSYRLVGELGAELAAANTNRADLAARLLAQEQRVRGLEAAVHDGQPPGALLWSMEGLSYQPRMSDLVARAQGTGFTPGTTTWRPSMRAIPAQFTQSGSAWRSPGALVVGLAHALELGGGLGQDKWETTARVYMQAADTASAIIMSWGWKDDSVAGKDYLLALRQQEGNWYVTEIQERFHAYRGLANDTPL